MAMQPTRRGKSEPTQPRRTVMASVKLDVTEHARVAAAASLAGIDKSTWMRRAIVGALRGVLIIDRRGIKSDGPASPDAEIGQESAE